ncbi:MAG: sel1 repeat family protein [archaeon]|nr:sel1 repeat family protein [archaeon]
MEMKIAGETVEFSYNHRTLISLGYDCEISQKLQDCFGLLDAYPWSWVYQSQTLDLKSLDIAPPGVDDPNVPTWYDKGIEFTEINTKYHTKRYFGGSDGIDRTIYEEEKRDIVSRHGHMHRKLGHVFDGDRGETVFLLKVLPIFSIDEKKTYITNVNRWLGRKCKAPYRLGVILLERDRDGMKGFALPNVDIWFVGRYNLNADREKIPFKEWIGLRMQWYRIIDGYSRVSLSYYLKSLERAYSARVGAVDFHIEVPDDIYLYQSRRYELCRMNPHYSKSLMNVLLDDPNRMALGLAKELYLSSRDKPFLSTLVRTLSDQGLSDPGFMEKVADDSQYGYVHIAIGRMYRQGGPVAKDLDAARFWMEQAVQRSPDHVKEYLDLLEEIGTPESSSEADYVVRRYIDRHTDGSDPSEFQKTIVEYLRPSAEAGMKEMQARLGRAYRDGKGVDVDLDKAAYWMGKAADQGLSWAMSEYFDILWKMDTLDASKAAVEYARPLAESGRRELQGRLGRAYRDGKGVDVDLDKAAYWMRKAADNGLIWAPVEYFDILWKIGTPDSLKTAVEYAVPMANVGRKGMQVCLGRAYRDGKGVGKDLYEAAYWMKRDADKGVYRAPVEYFDILWKIGTPDSLKTAVEYARPLAESGRRELQGRLGRAYRDGKGVDVDLDKAAYWMKKAMDKGLPWAEKEYAALVDRPARDDGISINRG